MVLPNLKANHLKYIAIYESNLQIVKLTSTVCLAVFARTTVIALLLGIAFAEILASAF